MEHKMALRRYRIDGSKPDDNIEYKLIETDGESLFIVDLDIKNKAVSLTGVSDALPDLKMMFITREEL